MIINYPYQTPEVRDLAWACFSPPVLHIEQVTGYTSGIAACALQLTPERRLWLARLDHDPSSLLEHLSLRSTNHHDPMGYAHEWLGPDSRDRLDTKMDQLLQRQIKLSEHPSAEQKLHELGIGKLAKEIAFKGYLFQPTSAVPPPPPGYNPACPLNLWLTCDQLRSHCNKLNTESYLILTKMKWLCSAHLGHLKNALNVEQLQTQVTHYFDCDTYPLLIASLDKNGAETARFFVTPEFWPDSMSRKKSPLVMSQGA